MYGILLKNGNERIKCKDCGGEGSLPIHGSLKVCRLCGGLGTVPVIEEVQRVLRQFRLPANYTVSHEHSVILKFRLGYPTQMATYFDDIIHSFQALTFAKIPARIIFPIH